MVDDDNKIITYGLLVINSLIAYAKKGYLTSKHRTRITSHQLTYCLDFVYPSKERVFD